ncbi:MAG: CPBP family intramembrane metalloprotease [Gammaproteobacteria bacterium]|nr:CPBP family intramembrane metalloprotease [Gammaproteobacteria bacterium]
MSFEFTARQNRFGALLAFGFFLVYFASMYVGGVIGSVLYDIVYATDAASNSVTASSDARVILVVIKRISGMLFGGCILFFLLRRCVQRMPQAVSFAELGFVRSSWVKCIFFYLLGLTLSLFFMVYLRELFPFDGERSPDALEGINEVAERFTYIAVFCLIVLAPLNEEALFRGALYLGFKKSFGRIVAALFVTLLFASVHPDAYFDGYWVNILALLSYSTFLVVLRVCSGSLYPSMSMHAGINSALIFPAQIFAG